MKHARLSFALVLVLAGGAACSAAEATGPVPESPRSSVYIGSGNDTNPTTQPADTTQQKS